MTRFRWTQAEVDAILALWSSRSWESMEAFLVEHKKQGFERSAAGLFAFLRPFIKSGLLAGDITVLGREARLDSLGRHPKPPAPAAAPVADVEVDDRPEVATDPALARSIHAASRWLNYLEKQLGKARKAGDQARVSQIGIQLEARQARLAVLSEAAAEGKRLVDVPANGHHPTPPPAPTPNGRSADDVDAIMRAYHRGHLSIEMVIRLLGKAP